MYTTGTGPGSAPVTAKTDIGFWVWRQTPTFLDALHYPHCVNIREQIRKEIFHSDFVDWGRTSWRHYSHYSPDKLRNSRFTLAHQNLFSNSRRCHTSWPCAHHPIFCPSSACCSSLARNCPQGRWNRGDAAQSVQKNWEERRQRWWNPLFTFSTCTFLVPAELQQLSSCPLWVVELHTRCLWKQEGEPVYTWRTQARMWEDFISKLTVVILVDGHGGGLQDTDWDLLVDPKRDFFW